MTEDQLSASFPDDRAAITEAAAAWTRGETPVPDLDQAHQIDQLRTRATAKDPTAAPTLEEISAALAADLREIGPEVLDRWPAARLFIMATNQKAQELRAREMQADRAAELFGVAGVISAAAPDDEFGITPYGRGLSDAVRILTEVARRMDPGSLGQSGTTNPTVPRLRAYELLRGVVAESVAAGRSVSLAWVHDRSNPVQEPIGGVLVTGPASAFQMEDRTVGGELGYVWWTVDLRGEKAGERTQSADTATARAAALEWLSSAPRLQTTDTANRTTTSAEGQGHEMTDAPFRELESDVLSTMTPEDRARFDAALDEEEGRQNLAEMVYQARIAAGLTQAQLAASAGSSQSTIAALETGTQTPTIALLQRIGDATGNLLSIELQRAH
jgi:ribosome-binding protein aMBF1 (putative translation factor)